MFGWLGKSYDERSSWLFALKVEPIFREYRDQSRFTDLLRRIGLPTN
jgi:hypothetical protein